MTINRDIFPVWGYRDGESKLFRSEADVGDDGAGWLDSADPALGVPLFGEAKAAPSPDQSIDQLRSEAEALGIKVDGRWKEPRLIEEIEAARNGNGA